MPMFQRAQLCKVSFRICPRCERLYCCPTASRRKFCRDLCTATAIVERSGGKLSVKEALAHMNRQRVYREQRRSYHTEVVLQRKLPAPGPLVPPPVHANPRNTHRPGSIAFALVYGDRRPFSRGDGDFVGRAVRAKRTHSLAV